MSNDEHTITNKDDDTTHTPHLSLSSAKDLSANTNEVNADTSLSKKKYWIKTDLSEQIQQYGFEIQPIIAKSRWLPRWLFSYPAVKPSDSERGYLTRVKVRVFFIRLLLCIFLATCIVSGYSIWFSVNELIIKPSERKQHVAFLEGRFDSIVSDTQTQIDPINPVVPEWLWSRFSPSWYIEDAVYASDLDLSDHDIELLSHLREKKAIVEREIEPAYSNDKIQNRLRDPNIIYFGSEYDRAYRRYVNMILTIIALNYDDTGTGQLDRIYSEKRRTELLNQVTTPKPPEPNAYYDHRVDSLLTLLESKRPLYGEESALVAKTSAESEAMLTLLDNLSVELSNEELTEATSNGLGPLLRRLPYGWGSTNLTRQYYAEKRNRYINWNILELRLLMLELIYGAAQLPQELPLVHLYLYHLGGMSYQSLFTEVSSKKLMSTANEWVAEDKENGGAEDSREQRFIDAFMSDPNLKVDEDSDSNKRISPCINLKGGRVQLHIRSYRVNE